MVFAPGRRGLLVDRRDHLGVATRRVPHADPAVAEQRGATHRGIGPPADDQRHRRARRRDDEHVVQVEELAVEGRRLAGEQRAQHLEALVHATATRARVDAADRVLVRVLAADADTEDQAPGREQLEVGDLAGDERRMAKREQVDGHVDRDGGVGHRERRRAQEAVRPRADEETDVVGRADVVEAARRRSAHEGAHRFRGGGRPLEWWERAEPDLGHAHDSTPTGGPPRCDKRPHSRADESDRPVELFFGDADGAGVLGHRGATGLVAATA